MSSEIVPPLPSQASAPTVDSAKGRWKLPFILGTGCGCVTGLLLGGLVLAFAGWAWLTVEEESSTNPLQDLHVAAGKLSDEQLMTHVDQLAAEYLNDPANVGLVIGLIENERSQVRGYGRKSKDSPAAPDSDTLFEIASVGKTFTGILLAEMALKGEVDLHDPLRKFLPNGVKVPQQNGREITLLDLATHTSGLPSLPPNFTPGDPLNPYRDYTTEQMLAGLAAIQLERAPGTTYEYSNLGFGLLGYALAQHKQQNFETLVLERITTPLQMSSTRIELDAELRGRIATPHDGGKAVPVWEDTTMPGAGSFLSTGRDLVRFVQAHWGQTDVPANLQEAMDLATRKHRRGSSSSESVGLGWHLTPENALDIHWHNGGSGGSCSYVAFLNRPPVGVVVLSNSSSSVDELGRKLLYLLAWHRG